MPAAEGLTLSVYFGERERAEGHLLADTLMDLFARHGVTMSLLLRGTQGFGRKQLLRSERLLTLSEDLPLCALAYDSRQPIEALAAEVTRIVGEGVITLERAGLGAIGEGEDGAADQREAKLTVMLARRHRVRGRPAYEAAVAVMHRHGMHGASMMLGLDGTVAGRRERARFLGANGGVPSIVVGVGEGASVAAARRELAEILPGAPASSEHVRLCKRDGVLLSRPREPLRQDEDAWWQKLVVHSDEHSRHEGTQMHEELVRRLRAAGAAGATTLRGAWGFHGRHEPHGEALLSLRRRTPLQTVLLDTPANVARWFEIVDELTGSVGLVTCEDVPALRSAGAGTVHGGLRLARAAAS